MRASLQIPAARPRVAAVRPAARKLLSPGVVRVPVATVFCAAGGVADRSNEVSVIFARERWFTAAVGIRGQLRRARLPALAVSGLQGS